jgi:hypothetical protein
MEANMATKQIDFDRPTDFQSLGRNGFISTHGITISALGQFGPDQRGTVWFEPVTSRGPSEACRVVIAETALDEVIAALIDIKNSFKGPKAEVNRVLFVSTAHCPEEWLDNQSQHIFKVDGQASFAGRYGIVLWAPDDPDNHDWDEVPDMVQAVLRHARKIGCTHVVFDTDADVLEGFETRDEEDNRTAREGGFIVEYAGTLKDGVVQLDAPPVEAKITIKPGVLRHSADLDDDYCRGCGRLSGDCSRNPCEAVIADRSS